MGIPSHDRAVMQIAEEAARIIAEEGEADFQAAKYKAARRLGLSTEDGLPNNVEIEDALLLRQKLFATKEQIESLAYLRKLALEVMTMLDEFDPCVVGPVLKGTASSDTIIHLHVFAEDSKNVAIALLNKNIDFNAVERRVTVKNPGGIHGFRFRWQAAVVEILVFPADKLRISPPSPIDGKPMARADAKALEALIEAG